MPEGPAADAPVDPDDAVSGGAERAQVRRETADEDVGAPSTGAAMTRSQDELLIERVLRPHERVRLVKYVVTESVTHTVELRREELRVEREPIDEGGPAGTTDGRDQPLDIVLYEEQVVIEKRVVPRERVRVTKQLITEERPLTTELRREEIVLDQGDGQGTQHDRKATP